MDNCIYKCPTCDEKITLMDVVGARRLNDACTWWEQADIDKEWGEYIEKFKIKHDCL